MTTSSTLIPCAAPQTDGVIHFLGNVRQRQGHTLILSLHMKRSQLVEGKTPGTRNVRAAPEDSPNGTVLEFAHHPSNPGTAERTLLVSKSVCLSVIPSHCVHCVPFPDGPEALARRRVGIN